VIAGMDAWKDADLPIANGEEPDWDSGTILVQERLVLRNFVSIYKIDDFQTRRLGSTAVAQQ
jgi:hypothetical protein